MCVGACDSMCAVCMDVGLEWTTDNKLSYIPLAARLAFLGECVLTRITIHANTNTRQSLGHIDSISTVTMTHTRTHTHTQLTFD